MNKMLRNLWLLVIVAVFAHWAIETSGWMPPHFGWNDEPPKGHPANAQVPPGPTLGRTGFPKYNYTEPHWEIRHNAFGDIVESDFCRVPPGGGQLDCGEAVSGVLPVLLDPPPASGVNYEFFPVPFKMTLVKAECHCESACTTPLIVTFSTRNGSSITLQSPGTLVCGTGTGTTSTTSFDPSDSNTHLIAHTGLRLHPTVSADAGQRDTILLYYTIP